MGEIVALILAAGESKRMNSPKMLLPFDGKTIIETVINKVLASAVDKTVVVLGSDREKVIEVIKDYPVTICQNEKFRTGMLSSVKCGIQSLPAGYEAILVFLGDQPMISAEVTDAVIREYRRTMKPIVMPVCKKKRGHPLLIRSDIICEIEKLDAEEGLHLLARKFPDDVSEVETDDITVLKDIDTPEDYQGERNQIY